jgi:hypothetical protein
MEKAQLKKLSFNELNDTYYRIAYLNCNDNDTIQSVKAELQEAINNYWSEFSKNLYQLIGKCYKVNGSHGRLLKIIDVCPEKSRSVYVNTIYIKNVPNESLTLFGAKNTIYCIIDINGKIDSELTEIEPIVFDNIWHRYIQFKEQIDNLNNF